MGNRPNKVDPSFFTRDNIRYNIDRNTLLPNVQRDFSIEDAYKQFQFFFSDNIWWKAKNDDFINPEKFIYHYSGYQKEQQFLTEIWASEDLNNLENKKLNRVRNKPLHSQWKSKIRRGIPFDKWRFVILEIFKLMYSDNQLAYECAVKSAFGDNIPESFVNIPPISSHEQIHQVLKVHFLNVDGVYTVEKLLWVFYKNVPNLKYCPMLPQVLSLLLLFVTEAEAYAIGKTMIEQSVIFLDESKPEHSDDMRGLRWYFPLVEEQFHKFIESFCRFLKKRCSAFSEIEAHFRKIEYDYIDFFCTIFESLFLGFFPLPLVIRIFSAYLNEGIKIYYRMGYAFVKVFKDLILNHDDAFTMSTMLKSKANNIRLQEAKALFTEAYALSLSKIKDKFSNLSALKLGAFKPPKQHYLPNILQPSKIIERGLFEYIWDWLPNDKKLCEGILAYSANEDGWRIKTMYQKVEPFKGRSMLLILKSNIGTVFGAFIDDIFQPFKFDYVGSNNCFVFFLLPEPIAFFSTSKNKYHLLSKTDYFSIGGGGDGAAFSLDEELNQGHTYHSETYNNPQFNLGNSPSDSSFKCVALEVYILA